VDDEEKREKAGENRPDDFSELDDLLEALMGAEEVAEDSQSEEPPDDAKEPPAEPKHRKYAPNPYSKIKDIPEDFLTFLLETDAKWAKRKLWRGIIRSIYENPRAHSTDIAKLLNTTPSTVMRTAERYRAMWNELREDYEEWKRKLEEGVPGESAPKLPPTKAPSPQPAPEPAPKKRGGSKGSTSGEKEEKIPQKLYEFTKSTTTFKEIDKTLSEVLGAQFHDTAVRKEVYARLGELLIFSLLQLGVVERDKIVAYSEQLSTDPDRLYEYVKNQLDAVLRLTDAETLQRVWVELTALRRQVRALEATADMLSDTLKEYEDAIRFLMGLLTRDQLEKFSAYVFMKEFMKQYAPLQGAVPGGGR